jgi:hypothetical protein
MESARTKAKRKLSNRHRQERRRLAPRVNRGTVRCVFCGELIEPGEPWDLDHKPDLKGWTGPAHRHCNRSAGAAKGNRARKLRQSREW